MIPFQRWQGVEPICYYCSIVYLQYTKADTRTGILSEILITQLLLLNARRVIKVRPESIKPYPSGGTSIYRGQLLRMLLSNK